MPAADAVPDAPIDAIVRIENVVKDFGPLAGNVGVG